MSQSLDRSLQILDVLEAGPQRLGEIAEAVGVHKSTALRSLQVLERHGYVRREGDVPRFTLGLRMLELASRVLERLDLRDVARDNLLGLAATTGETVHLATLSGDSITYLDKAESRHAVRMYSRVGGRAPAYCTGLGKVLLAYLPVEQWPQLHQQRFTPNTITDREELLAEAARIREAGWGVDEREHEETIRCIAAPVFDQHGVAVAAVSISVPTTRMSVDDLHAYVPKLLAATDDVSRQLGYRGVDCRAS